MRAILSLVLSIAVAAAAGACARDAAGDPDDGVLDVVASFYPLAEAARRTGGSAVEVVDLTPSGVEPHDVELTPDDLEAIATADVVLALGGSFQPAVDAAVEAEASGTSVDVLADLGPPAEDELVGDPHVWLDPARYASIVERVGSALADATPSQADAIRRRTAAAVAELDRLDADFREGLASCDRRLLVTNHAAFGHLAAAYGLRQEAIAGMAPEAEPDPARLAELVRFVRDEGVTTIFTEELVSSEVADALAAEAGVSTAVLSPLEGLADDRAAAGEDYVSVMERNLEVLRAGLGCD